MTEAFAVILPIGGFLVIFPLFWIAVVWLISRLGSWSRLARSFAASGPASGETFGWVSAQLGWFANYSSCLTVTVSGKGLHIEPWSVFKFGHRPLFVPWQAVEQMTVNQFMLGTASRLRVDGTTLKLFGKGLAESLERHAPRKLREPDRR